MLSFSVEAAPIDAAAVRSGYTGDDIIKPARTFQVKGWGGKCITVVFSEDNYTHYFSWKDISKCMASSHPGFPQTGWENNIAKEFRDEPVLYVMERKLPSAPCYKMVYLTEEQVTYILCRSTLDGLRMIRKIWFKEILPGVRAAKMDLITAKLKESFDEQLASAPEATPVYEMPQKVMSCLGHLKDIALSALLSSSRDNNVRALAAGISELDKVCKEASNANRRAAY